MPDSTKGLCFGSFDLFHVGHVLFLEECKNHCNHLTVVIGSDYEIKLRKGLKRPIYDEQARLKIVQSNRNVDEAFIMPFPLRSINPFKVLKEIFNQVRPDIFFVNDDLSSGRLVEKIYLKALKRFCIKNNVQLLINKRDNKEYQKYSTTDIIRKLNE